MRTNSDWIDRPVWTPEKLEEARRAAEKRREAEWLNAQREYQWFLHPGSYGGSE